MRRDLTAFLDAVVGTMGNARRRRWCDAYIRGILLDGHRKSVEPMAARLRTIEQGEEDYEQALQQFLNQSPWDADDVRDGLQAWVARRFGTAGVVILDDTGFPKQGTHSVGVARQYTGTLGKVASCQVAVTLQFATAEEVVGLDAQLYLPEAWADDGDRMARAGVPTGVGYRPKWQMALADRLTAGRVPWRVDSFPLPACQFARATSCRRFRGTAGCGYDHCLKRTMYGFRVHLRTDAAGVIPAVEVAPARATDKAPLPEMAGPPGTVGIGDRGHYAPELAAERAAAGVRFLTPYLHESKEPAPTRAAALAAIRYRLETVNGQRVDRYHAKRMWARDAWHLTHRITRKVLSHTAMVCLTRRLGYRTLSFDNLQLAA